MTSPQRPPLFTIVIPTYNRIKSLEACLNAIAKQELSRECFETVIVDDGAPRRCAELSSVSKGNSIYA